LITNYTIQSTKRKQKENEKKTKRKQKEKKTKRKENKKKRKQNKGYPPFFVLSDN